MSDIHSAPEENDLPTPRRLPPARARTRPTSAGAPPPAAMTDDAGDYEVGYGKPPKDTQFKPGTSGNPKGRPKRAKSLNVIVRDNLTQKVPVRTANGQKKITRIEAVLHKTVEQAMKGNPRALGELIKLYGSAVPEEKTDSAPNEREEALTAADLSMLAEYRQEIENETGDSK